MARREKDLSGSLRSSGVRRKVADEHARAANGSAGPGSARRAASDLATVVAEVQDRLEGGAERRSAAAKKGARTRARG